MDNLDQKKPRRSNRPKKRWKKGLIISLIIFLLLIILIGGYLLNLYNKFGNDIYRNIFGEDEQGITTDNDFGISDLFANTFDEPLTILALGVDAREGETIDHARSDTIMLITIHPDTKQVATVSFPRDTYVNIPGHGYTKLNHSMSYGGIPLLTETIEENFDVEIDNYVAIDFVAFTSVVDILGGLEVYTPSSMYYVASDIHVELEPGYHTLNGEELLGYVRYRHDAAGDLGRIQRQQYVIRSLGEKATSLKGVLKAPQILDSLGEHIITDLNKSDILSIAKAYRSFSNDDWHTMTLGGEAARSSYDGIWYYYYSGEDKRELEDFINAYLNGKKD